MTKALADDPARYPFMEQDALNATLKGGFAPLSPRYNFMGDFFLLDLERRIDPIVLHFVNAPKPWRFDAGAARPASPKPIATGSLTSPWPEWARRPSRPHLAALAAAADEGRGGPSGRGSPNSSSGSRSSTVRCISPAVAAASPGQDAARQCPTRPPLAAPRGFPGRTDGACDQSRAREPRAHGPGQAADLFGAAPPASSPASQAPTAIEIGSNWYLRGDIGASFDNGPTVSVAPISIPPQASQPLAETGANARSTDLDGGLGFGYRFSDYLRIDATWDYRTGAGRTRSRTVVCPYGLYGGAARRPATCWAISTIRPRRATAS